MLGNDGQRQHRRIPLTPRTPLSSHHQENLNITLVVDEESLEAVRHHVASLLVGSVTNLGHGELSLETAANPVVDTCESAEAVQSDPVSCHRPAALPDPPLGFLHASLTPW